LERLFSRTIEQKLKKYYNGNSCQGKGNIETMARRASKKQAGPEAPAKGMKKKASSGRRKNFLGGAASVAILGSLILTAEPCRSSDFELSFISVHKKPPQSSRERDYAESSRAAKEASCSSAGEKAYRPEHIKTYYESLLLDFRAEEQTVAITDCGYCNCTRCICPASCANCDACVIPDCTTECNVCACAACACPCYCVCDCTCSAYACNCGKSVCACQCACQCPNCGGMCGYCDCSKM
jgi:hypothetical protein